MTSTNPTQPTPMSQEDLLKLIAAQSAQMEQMKQQMLDMKSTQTKSDSTVFTPYIIPGSMMLPDKANSLSSLRVMTEAIKREVESLTEVECAKPEVKRSFRLMISLLNRTVLSNHTPWSKTKPEVKTQEIAAMNALIAAMKSRKLITDESPAKESK
jgi:hypothetical protein